MYSNSLPHSTLQSSHLLRETFIALEGTPPAVLQLKERVSSLKRSLLGGNKRRTETNHLTPLSTWNGRSLPGICPYIGCYFFVGNCYCCYEHSVISTTLACGSNTQGIMNERMDGPMNESWAAHRKPQRELTNVSHEV